ncbi:MAG: DUF922 domain-containing protein [Accumulibacter sp.]
MGLKYLGPFGSGVSVRFHCKTLGDVGKEIETRNKHPKFKIAYVKSKMKYICDSDNKSGEIIPPLYLEVKLFLFMPDWKYTFRPMAEQTEWLRFYKALYIHEKGHVEIYDREIRVMYARMGMTRTQRELKDVFKNEKRRIRNLQDEYDAYTHHGRRQNSDYGSTILMI